MFQFQGRVEGGGDGGGKEGRTGIWHVIRCCRPSAETRHRERRGGLRMAEVIDNVREVSL